jgi:hypothetical protein
MREQRGGGILDRRSVTALTSRTVGPMLQRCSAVALRGRMAVGQQRCPGP